MVFVPGLWGWGRRTGSPEARGLLFGLTRYTTAADLGRAVLEGVADQAAGPTAAAMLARSSPLGERGWGVRGASAWTVAWR